MLLTVTPNPCIERTAVLPQFGAGHSHRVPPEAMRVSAGGKGINVSRVAMRLGIRTLATGWVGRRQQAWFHEELVAEGVEHDFVESENDTRVCVNILDGQGGETEIVEAGAPPRPGDGQRLLDKIESLLPRCSMVAICGSYPGSAVDSLTDHLTALCRLARCAGKLVLVDGKGPALRNLLSSDVRPWCIKPNLLEAEEYWQRQLKDQGDELLAVKEFMALGVPVVMLSCGNRGLYVGSLDEVARERVWFVSAPPVKPVSAVGSGDSLVGAFLARTLLGDDVLEAGRWGAAAGAANAASPWAGCSSLPQIENLLPAVGVQRLL